MKNKFICALVLCLIIPLCLIFQGCEEMKAKVSFTYYANIYLKLNLVKSDSTFKTIFDNTVGFEQEYPPEILYFSDTSILLNGEDLIEYSEIEMQLNYGINKRVLICCVSVSNSDKKLYISSEKTTPTIERYPITSNENIEIVVEDFAEIKPNFENASIDLNYADNNIYQGGEYYYHKGSVELKIVPDADYHLPETIKIKVNSHEIEDEDYTFVDGILTIERCHTITRNFIEISLNAIANT